MDNELDELEPRLNGDTEPAPPLGSSDQDDDEITMPEVGSSNWARVFRMLRNITNKVNAIDQTQVKQLEVAKTTLIRLAAVELALREKKA
jgi:hypothetical protein